VRLVDGLKTPERCGRCPLSPVILCYEGWRYGNKALDALFDAHPHVVGVVLTSGEQRLGGPAVDADHAGCQGMALKRTMPDVLVRYSTVAVVGSPLRDSARW
jgi:hypothetical protein